MVSGKDVYHVVEAIVPLYFAMLLAYLSVKWWKLFTPEQCFGINKFVAKFVVPLLTFQVISTYNIYKMNLKIICADLLQKLITFIALAAIAKFSSRGRFSWIITGLSLSTLPNALIVGIPLLQAMYGEEATSIITEIVVLQGIIWLNLLIILYELNSAIKAAPIAPIPEPTTDLCFDDSYCNQPIGRREVFSSPTLEVDLEVPPESQAIPGRKVKSMHVLLETGRKLLMNPNTYATLLSLIWSCIHFRWEVKLPEIINQSILIMSKGGMGMSMFSLGLFLALRPRIISCGTIMAAVAMALRFIIGPAIMAASSLSIGLRGTSFKIAFMQAALPLGAVPFVIAKEYNVHPDVLSTGVLLSMLITLPITLAYYSLLALL